MDRSGDLPAGRRRPPETTAEPVPMQRPYLSRFGATHRTAPEPAASAPPPEASAPEAPAPVPTMQRWRPMRGVIGDDVRTPMLWCEFGRCIRRYSHTAATSDQDLHQRAVTDGWRTDGHGRLACPGCAQHDPAFLTAARPTTQLWPGWH
ncbi:MAG TPA: hypothetical protein VGD91_25910 [Trebonia sp.]